MTHEITTQIMLRGMDSREIAQLTGKQHAHVCRDIQRMLDELQIAQSKFGSGYLDAQNQRRRCFVLPKRECLILATGEANGVTYTQPRVTPRGVEYLTRWRRRWS